MGIGCWRPRLQCGSALIPVTIVGGYLGAGKTTLINNMLRNASGQRLAILVNEFGELPIDEDLIEAQSDEMISLAGGCICCSFGDNLVEALVSLSKWAFRKEKHHARISRLESVVNTAEIPIPSGFARKSGSIMFPAHHTGFPLHV